MANEYNIFTSEIDNFADPMRTDLFSVTFYDTRGYSYRYAVLDSSQFYPVRATLPKQSNILAKRWYFGSYRQDVINSDRGGETTLEFYMRCDQPYNMKMLQFLGMAIGDEFLDEELRYKHIEFDKNFDRIEIVTRDNEFKDGLIYTLYNCNVHEISFGDLDASNSEILKLTANISYDTHDIRASKEWKYRDDIGKITKAIG